MTNKLDFHDWKRHPVTQQVFSQLKDMEAQLIEELIEQTATAPFPTKMAEKTGAIKALRSLINIEYEGGTD